jgi:hypothetical protein
MRHVNVRWLALVSLALLTGARNEGCAETSENDDGAASDCGADCAHPANGCVYQDVHYEVGQGFPSADGCNTCGCQGDGSVACTEMACLDGCATDADCHEGEHCEGSSVCPAEVECFWEGEPGVCVPDVLDEGCFSDAECAEGWTCEGESVCPPEAACFAADTPGRCTPPGEEPARCFSSSDCHEGDYCTTEDGECASACADDAEVCIMACAGSCKPRTTECTADECGPAPMAPNYLCADGETWAGPGACERQEGGTCGWTWTQCPVSRACGDHTCADGDVCIYRAGNPPPHRYSCEAAWQYAICDSAVITDCGCVDTITICAGALCDDASGMVTVACLDE